MGPDAVLFVGFKTWDGFRSGNSKVVVGVDVQEEEMDTFSYEKGAIRSRTVASFCD